MKVGQLTMWSIVPPSGEIRKSSFWPKRFGNLAKSKYHGLSISKCSSSIARIFNHKESLNTAMDALLDFLIPSLPSIPPDIETLRIRSKI